MTAHWLTFVGEGRSGHTILSGAIGSHPYARIAEEQKLLAKGLTRDFTQADVLKVARGAAAGRTRRGQGWTGLDHHLEPVAVLGDKCGWDAVNLARKGRTIGNPLVEFEQFIELPVKVIVTVRNPWDNIATWAVSPKYQRIHGQDRVLIESIRRYRRFYTAAHELIQGTDYRVVYHEELLERPHAILNDLREWLELPEDEEWMSHCLGLIWADPREKRHLVNWGEDDIHRTRWIIDNNPLMEYYR